MAPFPVSHFNIKRQKNILNNTCTDKLKIHSLIVGMIRRYPPSYLIVFNQRTLQVLKTDEGGDPLVPYTVLVPTNHDDGTSGISIER